MSDMDINQRIENIKNELAKGFITSSEDISNKIKGVLSSVGLDKGLKGILHKAKSMTEGKQVDKSNDESDDDN